MSVALATELKPVPPEIVSVSVPEVTVWLEPESPATVNDVAILAIVLLTFDIAVSTSVLLAIFT